MTSGKDIMNKNAEQTLPWLLQFLETAEDSELALLLKNLDCCTSGDRAVVDVVSKFQAMSRRDILDSYADPSELKQAESVTGLRELRWLRIKHALRALRPTKDKLEPETQLNELRRNIKKENLLDFVLRYRRTADSFLRQGVVAKARCMQLLYQKLPKDLQKSMWTMPFGSASLDSIEDVVRNRMNWLAIVAKGTYTYEELSEYLALDAIEQYAPQVSDKERSKWEQKTGRMKVDIKASTKGGDKAASRERETAGSPRGDRTEIKAPGVGAFCGGVRYEAASDAEDLMRAWKTLMDQPHYRRQAERFLGVKREIMHSDSASTLHGADPSFAEALRGNEAVGREAQSDTPPPTPSQPPRLSKPSEPPMLSRRAYKPPMAPAMSMAPASRRFVL